MSRTVTAEKGNAASNDMRAEYNLDYCKARPNRFAGRVDKSRVVVLLDPDISRVFTSSESVNTVLRALIETMPQAKPKTARPPSKRVRKERA